MVQMEHFGQKRILFPDLEQVELEKSRPGDPLSDLGLPVVQVVEVVGSFQQHLALVVHKLRRLGLEEQGPGPYALPINHGCNAIAMYK